jgi:iron complex transport system ATP-binding protein
MIEVSGVSVRLSGKTIISDVGFTAEAGRMTAIAGPNGSGKTTVMKACPANFPMKATSASTDTT